MSDRKAPALWNREIVSRASIDSFVKLDPRLMIKNPVMFVVEVTSVLVMFTLFRDLLASSDGAGRIRISNRAVAVVHRAVRKLRRGDGRRPRQGAGR